MKFLKKFNEEVFPDDEYEDMKTISENEYDDFINENESEPFCKNELELIKREMSKLKSKISFDKIKSECLIQIDITTNIGLFTTICKFKDEWFLVTLDDMISNFIFSTDERLHMKCDQILGLESFFNFIHDEIKFKRSRI